MWKLKEFNKEHEKAFLEMGHDRLVARLLAQRPISPDQAAKFLHGTLNDLSPAYSLKGVQEASEIFLQSVQSKENIAVMGDYDCDGVISSVMIKELCNVFGLACMVFLPHRVEHGYGLNKKTIQAFKDKAKGVAPDLLFVLDCGSNSEEEIKELKSFGVKKIIIIDHHIIDSDKASKSADVFINWHNSGFAETCTCGEVYHLVRGIRKTEFDKKKSYKANPMEFLTYAAIGILADVSPIIDDNRIIVTQGLRDDARRHIMASGLPALFSKAFIKSCMSQEDILFKIAPRINAAGRLETPDQAYRLLIENDVSTAELMAGSLSEINDRRKAEQKEIEKEAIDMVLLNPSAYEHGIVLFNEKWSIGIVGIVASKIVEKFHKPTLIISKNPKDGTIKGSGRSLGGINLKEVLDLCKDMFTGYGGHAMAAGVTVKSECRDKVNEEFNKACSLYYQTHERPTDISYYHVSVKPSTVSLKTVDLLLTTIYPYCDTYNQEPVFALENVMIIDVNNADAKKKDTKTGKATVWKAINFKAEKDGEQTELRFRMYTDDLGTEINGRVANVYFSLPQTTQNTFNSPPQCNVVDLVFKN